MRIESGLAETDEFKEKEEDYIPPPRYWLHILLFILTLITTTMAGTEMITNQSWLAGLVWSDGFQGLTYSLSFLAFLTAHEFGHYFMAMYHQVRCSLPYFLPVFIPGLPINIGSFGAVIRLYETPSSNVKIFDVGVAGPLAGFIISIGLLTYGFSTLPPLEYLYQMNPEYLSEFGHVPSYAELIEKKGELGLLHIGNSLIFYFFESFVADPRRLPNHLEIQHYPFLFAGFITLFFTALNLLPVGQLDGGHITYGLFGARIAGIISRIFVLLCVLYGGIGLIEYNHKLSDWLLPFLIYLAYAFFVVIRVTGRDKPLYAALIVGCILLIQYLISPKASLETNAIWLIYAFMAVSIIGLDHPPADTIEPLGIKRKIIGYLALVIFIISISPRPLFIHVSQSAIDKGIFTKK